MICSELRSLCLSHNRKRGSRLQLQVDCLRKAGRHKRERMALVRGRWRWRACGNTAVNNRKRSRLFCCESMWLHAETSVPNV